MISFVVGTSSYPTDSPVVCPLVAVNLLTTIELAVSVLPCNVLTSPNMEYNL